MTAVDTSILIRMLPMMWSTRDHRARTTDWKLPSLYHDLGLSIWLNTLGPIQTSSRSSTFTPVLIRQPESSDSDGTSPGLRSYSSYWHQLYHSHFVCKYNSWLLYRDYMLRASFWTRGNLRDSTRLAKFSSSSSPHPDQCHLTDLTTLNPLIKFWNVWIILICMES